MWECDSLSRRQVLNELVRLHCRYGKFESAFELSQEIENEIVKSQLLFTLGEEEKSKAGMRRAFEDSGYENLEYFYALEKFYLSSSGGDFDQYCEIVTQNCPSYLKNYFQLKRIRNFARK